MDVATGTLHSGYINLYGAWLFSTPAQDRECGAGDSCDRKVRSSTSLLPTGLDV